MAELHTSTPIWDEGRHMFLTDQYESKSKHLYYSGIRVSDRVIIMEDICKSLSFEFINAVEVYAFNGTDRTLIGRKEYECEFYDKESIRRDAETLFRDYLLDQLEKQHKSLDDKSVCRIVKEVIDRCYSSVPDADSLSKFRKIPVSAKES